MMHIDFTFYTVSAAKIWFQDSSVRKPSREILSYETTPKWHGFSMIRLAAFQASGWAEH